MTLQKTLFQTILQNILNFYSTTWEWHFCQLILLRSPFYLIPKLRCLVLSNLYRCSEMIVFFILSHYFHKVCQECRVVILLVLKEPSPIYRRLSFQLDLPVYIQRDMGTNLFYQIQIAQNEPTLGKENPTPSLFHIRLSEVNFWWKTTMKWMYRIELNFRNQCNFE